jgi:hypothetical protein
MKQFIMDTENFSVEKMLKQKLSAFVQFFFSLILKILFIMAFYVRICSEDIQTKLQIKSQTH